jgi:hypothetical protein
MKTRLRIGTPFLLAVLLLAGADLVRPIETGQTQTIPQAQERSKSAPAKSSAPQSDRKSDPTASKSVGQQKSPCPPNCAPLSHALLLRQQQREFANEMDGLKAIYDKHEPAFKAAILKLGIDSTSLQTQIEAGLQGINNHKDEGSREAQRAALRARYGVTFDQIMAAAGIGGEQLQREISAAINTAPNGVVHYSQQSGTAFSTPTNRELLLQYRGGVNSSSGAPAQPVYREIHLTSPFIQTGVAGGNPSTRVDDLGAMQTLSEAHGAGSDQERAFVSSALTIDRGVRRVVVDAPFDDVRYSFWGETVLGYANLEAIVNLRLMNGIDVIASDRVSLGRDSLIAFAFDDRYDLHAFPILHCEYERPTGGDAGRYTIVVELESWAGVGGIADGRTDMRGTVREFDVQLYR